jgi:pimeloyl-ACP methyl ester carboxylesterase
MNNGDDESSLTSPCLAVDQRGCGLSDDLSDETFSQDALVDDLYELIRNEPQEEGIILVGHSLGGRIALGYAAKYPETLAAVVVEDMDIQPRPSSTSPVPIPDFEKVGDGRKLFQRRAASKEEMTAILTQRYNYGADRVDEWWQQGRLVVQDDQSVRSNVNPDFRRLCYQHVLSTENGRRDCRTIAANTPSLPCHIMVAGTTGTVCFEESISEMKEILGDQLSIHRYPDAGHSIHSSDKEKFLSTMEQIIQSVSNSSDTAADSRL